MPPNSFDGRGNYTLGLKDQLVFPEIDYTRVDKIKGMNITITTTARNDEEGRELLKLLGVRSAFRTGLRRISCMARTSQIAKLQEEAEVQGSRSAIAAAFAAVRARFSRSSKCAVSVSAASRSRAKSPAS